MDQLDYVFSDMNCYVPHLLKYVAAKTLSAASRAEISAKEVWYRLIDQFGMDAEARSKTEMVLERLKDMTQDDWLVVRKWFIERGRRQLKLGEVML
jgi:hypothetical protein